MRTIIFSDTHLTSAFDQAKFKYLQNLIQESDRVIINGDFFDGYLTSFSDFLASPWNELLKLLNQKETYYLIGNHDRAASSDLRVKQFARWTGDRLELTIDGLKLMIEHGNRLAPSFDERWPWLTRWKLPTQLSANLEGLGVKLFGRRFFIIDKPRNMVMMQWLKKHVQPDTILICGHSHYPEYRMNTGFINSGLIRHRLASYILIENRRINLIKQRY
jgi:UDP-2,3-diacylglucosamine pyrophosphatase LpxH